MSGCPAHRVKYVCLCLDSDEKDRMCMAVLMLDCAAGALEGLPEAPGRGLFAEIDCQGLVPQAATQAMRCECPH